MKALNFVPGDTVRVHQKIKEDAKTRIQNFEGVVIAVRGRGENKTFTAKKVYGDIFVERIWPLNSPNIEKIEVKSHSKNKVRRAKLTYLQKTV